MRPRRKRSRLAEAAPAPAADTGPSEAAPSSKDPARRSDRRAAAAAAETSSPPPLAPPRPRQVCSKRQRVRANPAPRDRASRIRSSILPVHQNADRNRAESCHADDAEQQHPRSRSQESVEEQTDVVVVEETQMMEEVEALDRDIADASQGHYEQRTSGRVRKDRAYEEDVLVDAHVIQESDALLESVEDASAEFVEEEEEEEEEEEAGVDSVRDEGRHGEHLTVEQVEEQEIEKDDHITTTVDHDVAVEEQISVLRPAPRPPRRRSAVLIAHHREAPMRTQALLELLRNDEALCDAVIVAGNHELRIHRAIVAPLSPFFSAALSGDFSEAQDRRLVIGDASGEAMSVILDYAYGIEIEEELSEKPELALEVWKLAHRFTIDVLRDIAARQALKGVSVEASIRFFRETELYGTEKEIEKMFMFIARNFFDISQRCEDFYDLSVDFMLEFLCSKELIVSEWEKFQGIMEWVRGDVDKRTRYLEDLLHYVRFPLLNREWMLSSMKDIELLPKEVLAKAMMQSQHSGYLTNGHIMNQVDLSGSRSKNIAGWPRGAEFMMGMVCGKGGMSPKKETPFYFELLHWVISARIVNCVHGITLDFEFEQRLRNETTLERLSFEEDMQQHEFMIHVRLCSGGRVPNENLWFKTPKTRGGKARLILMENEVATGYFKDGGQGMNMVVSMQCRRKAKYWARPPIRGPGRGGYPEVGPEE